jgi:hypothetical protein
MLFRSFAYANMIINKPFWSETKFKYFTWYKQQSPSWQTVAHVYVRVLLGSKAIFVALLVLQHCTVFYGLILKKQFYKVSRYKWDIKFSCRRMSVFVFWAVTIFILVGRYQRFGGTYCCHLQGWIMCTYKSKWRYNSEDNVDTYLIHLAAIYIYIYLHT